MARDKKYWKRRLGKVKYPSPYQDHIDFRGIPDLNDDGLAYFLTGINGINMLDLNETEITNDSITLLSNLEYVNELRLKGCLEIDDDCISHLNKMTSLQFLHIKDTAITIDGILQLNALKNLRELLFSVEDIETVKDDMLLLKIMLPNCNFTINSVPYVFKNEI